MYPYPDNKYAYASDIEDGLHLLKLTGFVSTQPSDDDGDSTAYIAIFVLLGAIVVLAAVFVIRQKRNSPGAYEEHQDDGI